jgi:hypothetical protein
MGQTTAKNQPLSIECVQSSMQIQTTVTQDHTKLTSFVINRAMRERDGVDDRRR